MKFDLSTILINDLDGDGTKPHRDARGDPLTLGAALSQIIMIGQANMPRKEAVRRKALAKTYRLNGQVSIDTADRETLLSLAEIGGNTTLICIAMEAFEPAEKETA